MGSLRKNEDLSRWTSIGKPKSPPPYDDIPTFDRRWQPERSNIQAVDTGHHPHYPDFSQAEHSRGPNIRAAAPVRETPSDISLWECSWDHHPSDLPTPDADEDSHEKRGTGCLPFKKQPGQNGGNGGLIGFLKDLILGSSSNPRLIPATARPPSPPPPPSDAFRWIIRSVHLHPSALDPNKSKAIPSSWWVDFRIHLRSDLTIQEALTRKIPWEHHMRPAEEQMISVHDWHPSRFDTLAGQFWRRELSFWETPADQREAPAWKATLMFFHGQSDWLERQDPVGMVIRETTQVVEIYDAKNTTDPCHQLRDRWFLLDAVTGEYWNIGDRFDAKSASWIAENLLGLFRYQGSMGRPSGRVGDMPSP